MVTLGETTTNMIVPDILRSSWCLFNDQYISHLGRRRVVKTTTRPSASHGRQSQLLRPISLGILLHSVSRAHLGSIFRMSFFPIVPSQHKTSLKPAWSAFGCRSSGRCHDATLLNSVVWLSCINHFFICTLTQQDHTGCPFCYKSLCTHCKYKTSSNAPKSQLEWYYSTCNTVILLLSQRTPNTGKSLWEGSGARRLTADDYLPPWPVPISPKFNWNKTSDISVWDLRRGEASIECSCSYVSAFSVSCATRPPRIKPEVTRVASHMRNRHIIAPIQISHIKRGGMCVNTL